jgi:hypothetical protein
MSPLRANLFDVRRYMGDRSTSVSTIVEKLLLLRPHRAPENWIAMRETPEALDDVAVPLGMG